MSLQDLITKTITDGLKNIGVSADVSLLPDAIRITIKSDEVKSKIISGFPENVRKYISVESGDIIIKISLSVITATVSPVR